MDIVGCCNPRGSIVRCIRQIVIMSKKMEVAIEESRLSHLSRQLRVTRILL